jgi:hypothetical protein
MVGVLTRYWNFGRDLETLRNLLRLPQRPGDGSPAQRVKTQRQLTSDEAMRLAVRRRSGAEINHLADESGVHRATVINHLRRAGVEGRRNAGRALSPRDLQRAGQLYASGRSLIEVGERFNVDRRYLRRVLPEAGFTLRRPGRQPRSPG